MARFTGVKVEFPEILDFKRELRKFPSNIAAKHLGATVRKAAKPAQDALKAEVKANQKGPSGNLFRAIATKVVTYKRTGNAVAIVGFRKAGGPRAPDGRVQKGKDRAFHAGFLEFGTKQRRTKKGSIASSFLRGLTGFELLKPAKRGKYAGMARVRTKPKYPKAFFKRAPRGQTVNLGRTLPEQPIATSFRKSVGAIRSALQAAIPVAIEKAGKDLANKFPPKGTT